MLKKDCLERYSRQLPLAGIGKTGQEKLCRAKVLVAGAGGLGSPALIYLAAAGIGTIGIADGDTVSLSNLQRQILYSHDDIGRAKVFAAKARLLAQNPNLTVNTHCTYLDAASLKQIINSEKYDFVIEATDNYSSKFLINDVCVELGTPYSHGGVAHYQGEAMTYIPHHACYRCALPKAPEKPALTDAVFGAAAGTIGTVQAAEAIKYILGAGSLLLDTMLVYDAYYGDFRRLAIAKNPCCLCGK